MVDVKLICKQNILHLLFICSKSSLHIIRNENNGVFVQ